MRARLLLFCDSLVVLDPILLLLVGQDGDLGGGRGAGSAVHPLWTWWFLQVEPATQESGRACVFPLAGRAPPRDWRRHQEHLVCLAQLARETLLI